MSTETKNYNTRNKKSMLWQSSVVEKLHAEDIWFDYRYGERDTEGKQKQHKETRKKQNKDV